METPDNQKIPPNEHIRVRRNTEDMSFLYECFQSNDEHVKTIWAWKVSSPFATLDTSLVQEKWFDEEEQENILLRKTQNFINVPAYEGCYNILHISIQ